MFWTVADKVIGLVSFGEAGVQVVEVTTRSGFGAGVPMTWKVLRRSGGGGRDCTELTSGVMQNCVYLPASCGRVVKLQCAHLFVNTSSHCGTQREPPPGALVRPERRPNYIRPNQRRQRGITPTLKLLGGQMTSHPSKQIRNLHARIPPRINLSKTPQPACASTRPRTHLDAPAATPRDTHSGALRRTRRGAAPRRRRPRT